MLKISLFQHERAYLFVWSETMLGIEYKSVICKKELFLKEKIKMSQKNVSLGLTLRNTELENKDFCLLNGEVYSSK